MEEEVKTDSNVKESVPFFTVRNMKDSLQYYVDGLGFEIDEKW